MKGDTITITEYLTREAERIAIAIEIDRAIGQATSMAIDKAITIARADPTVPNELISALLQAQGAIGHSWPVLSLLAIMRYKD